MELITAAEGGSFVRICPVCASLAWNDKNDGVQTREPEEITGEAKRQLLEKRKLITVKEARAELRRSKKTESSE
jgi:hypothetical protein